MTSAVIGLLAGLIAGWVAGRRHGRAARRARLDPIAWRRTAGGAR